MGKDNGQCAYKVKYALGIFRLFSSMLGVNGEHVTKLNDQSKILETSWRDFSGL